MFRQIVVGVDGREGGRDAIALAKRLLAPEGELTLAHVGTGDPRIYRSWSAAYEASKRERALELLESTRREADVRAGARYVRSSSVGRGLHELAEREAADLLVIGCCRRSPINRILIGDDTRAALRGASCAVAVAPAGYFGEPVVMREIGVAYDGSARSERTLRVARELAAELGAKVSALQATSFSSTSVDAAFLPLSDAVDAITSEARDRIAALGDVEPHAVYGQPADELAVYSASLDLLIVGSRGYGAIGRLIHGSTSQQLARTARCPLLVLPRGARKSETSERRTVGRL